MMNLKNHISSGTKLFFALLAFVVVLFIPMPDVVINGELLALSVSGQRMLAILAFAIVVWVTEAVSYELSAVAIVVLIALFIGFSPDINNPEEFFGTAKALEISLYGFSNSSLALIAEALFISVAMISTGLGKRIALRILKFIGTTPQAILIGVILMSCVLSFLLPSSTARCACMIPIMIGIVDALGLSRKSSFAVALMVCVAQATNIWNGAILTAAGQNMQTVGVIYSQLGVEVPWLMWFLAGAPFSFIMSFVLYFLIKIILRPTISDLVRTQEIIKEQHTAQDPISRDEKVLLSVSVIMLSCWFMGGIPHPLNIFTNLFQDNIDLLPNIIPIDITTITAVGLIILLMPKLGVMNWKQIQQSVDWGTLIVFGVGISLGWALIVTNASDWIAGFLLSSFSLQQLGLFASITILAIFLIVIHLGFTSAVALSSSMIPIMIPAVHILTGGNSEQTVGVVLILGFFISFGFVLPINSPQGMLCLGTDTFTPKQFAKVGIPLTIVGFALMMLMAKVYWPYIGLV